MIDDTFRRSGREESLAMKIRLGIREKLVASMMATLIPFLALSLFWSYRRVEEERSKSNLEALRLATSGATIADEFITSTRGQEIIRTFGVDAYGEPLFVPDASAGAPNGE